MANDVWGAWGDNLSSRLSGCLQAFLLLFSIFSTANIIIIIIIMDTDDDDDYDDEDDDDDDDW